MTIGERVKKLRKEKGMTQEELAARLGYKSKSSVTHIENGRDIPRSVVVQLADILDTTPAYLMGWEDDPTIIKKIKAIDLFAGKEKLAAALEHEDTLRFITDHTYNIPIFESVSAGFGAYADDHIIGFTPLFIASPEKAQNTMVIIVSGNSMYPKIEDGDKIQVLRQDWAESGDIAVVLIDGEEAVVKKYVCDMEHETVTLQSINPEYAPRVFANKDIERLRVLGVVENIIKPVKRT